MKRLALQSMVAVAMVTCLLSSTQAGVIPWVYDVIFGPVRYPAYGPGYGASYAPQMSYGYSPYSYAPGRQCSPCSSNVGYAQSASPCANGRCSTGNCPTMVAYYPAFPMGYRVVSSQCSPCSTKKTDWRASDRAPEPRDEGKTTFAADEKDPFGAQKLARPLGEIIPVKPEGKTASEEKAAAGEATAATGAEATGASVNEKIKKDGWEETSKSIKEATAASEAKPGEATSDAAKAAAEAAAVDVVAPATGEAEAKPGETPAEAVKTELIGEGAAGDDVGAGGTTREGESTETPAKSTESGEATPGEAGDVKPLDVKPLEGEQNKAAWKISSPVRRIAFRASFRNVRIARVSRSIEADYVIPTASLTRIAER